MDTDFFSEISGQSEVKSRVVAEYFAAWANVMKSRSEQIAYIDLFAGPGRYLDGTKSTPLKVIEKIISDPVLRRKTIILLNDANPEYSDNLRTEIESLAGIDTLTHQPQIFATTIGEEIAERFERFNLTTFGFIDPWGYKGLSSRLISVMIRSWGSDCVFFFNRINMGLNNPRVIQHMNSIFGESRATQLRRNIKRLSPEEREKIILGELDMTLGENHRNYIMPFRFIRQDGKRTSHYLVLVSKHVLGYTIIKSIMHKCSSEVHDGVASFSYNPVSARQLQLQYTRPLDELGNELCVNYKDKTLTVSDVFNYHHINTPYIKENYKEALRRLEENGRVLCNPSNRQIRNGIKTMGDNVEVSFPR